ncbi:MAG: hypothetical protein JO113_01770 [Candidatus Eremiobacteraeota bacterium]|nr:hypothetical protein [Candidatus Eremiobacteraeota bacterium]
MGAPLDPKTAAAYGAFVQAAYAMYNADPNNLTPAPQGIPEGYQLIAWIQMTDFVRDAAGPNFYGFLAQQSTPENVFVLALRGTSNPIEWWDNFHATMVPFAQVPAAGNVAYGFERIYDTLEVVTVPAAGDVPRSLIQEGGFAQQISDVIQRRQATRASALSGDGPPVLPATAALIVTGHSLGAALLTLYVLDNVTNYGIRSPLFCSFASPRVGDSAFVEAFNALGLTSWRIVNAPDIVPNLPPDVFGYRHVDVLSLFDSTGKVQSTLSCAHSLETYLSLLDETLKPDPDCLPTPADAQLFAHALGTHHLMDSLYDRSISQEPPPATGGVV